MTFLDYAIQCNIIVAATTNIFMKNDKLIYVDKLMERVLDYYNIEDIEK